jgi:CDGSH-type Zn-finger protein/uncharacterized Fe-S cluster protein YjdI
MPHKRTYETDAIRVHWDSVRCIHTGICLRSLPHVFDTQRRPWVAIDAAEADEIARTVERCPSGALRYERLDGLPGEQPERPTLAVPIEDGPLLLVGDLLVEEADGTEITHEARLTLCRCGLSRNQPFCDNSHVRRGWKSGSVSLPKNPLPAPREGAREKPTKVIPLPDRSLELRGDVRLHDPDGQLLCEAGRAFLCRCGNSRNKPFCDMSHERVGFKSRAPELPRERLEAETPAAFTPNPDVRAPRDVSG